MSWPHTREHIRTRVCTCRPRRPRLACSRLPPRTWVMVDKDRLREWVFPCCWRCRSSKQTGIHGDKHSRTHILKTPGHVLLAAARKRNPRHGCRDHETQGKGKGAEQATATGHHHRQRPCAHRSQCQGQGESGGRRSGLQDLRWVSEKLRVTDDDLRPACAGVHTCCVVP